MNKTFFTTYNELDNELEAIEFELKNGKVAIVATDTVAGLISLNKNLIYKIKKRPHYKKLIYFISDVEDIPNLHKNTKILANQFWPGPLTLINNGISYRIPNNEFLIKIIKRFKKLHSTSANISGLEPIKNSYEAFSYFSNYKNDIIFIKGDYNFRNLSSTVFDVNKNKVLREGTINEKDIRKWI